MGFSSASQVDYNSLMIAISLVFLVVSTKLSQQSNPHHNHLFDEQNEIISPSSSFPSDTSPDELPVFVDATTSGEEDQGEGDDDDYEGIGIRNTKSRARMIPETETTRVSSRITQQQTPISSSSSSSSFVEEDQPADYLVNEVNWSRNPDDQVIRTREKMKSSSKSKRSGCDSGPPISARGLIGTTIKRSHFATSKAEVARRIEEEKNKKLKRNTLLEVADDESSSSIARNEQLHSSSCVTSHEWINLGNNHYPQFIKTAVCRSPTCGTNGLYLCQPKDYILKVLKRVSVSDSVCQEPQNDSLPSSLHSNWRLVTVKITHCCDCSNRLAISQI